MKKIITAVLILSVCLSLCGCGMTGKTEVEIIPAEIEMAAAPDGSGAESEEERQASESGKKLGSLLDTLITDYQPGTAGSSLRLAAVSAQLLDWYAAGGSDSAISKGTALFASAHDGYTDTQSEHSFSAMLTDAWYTAAEISFPGGDGILESAGYTRVSDAWTPQNTEFLFSSLFTTLGLEKPMTVTVYYGKLESARIPCFERNEYVVMGALHMAAVLPAEVQVNAFVHDGERLSLDIGGELVRYLNTLDAASEHMTLGCLVCSFLDSFGAETVTVTVDTEPLSTNYGIYDFAISRNDV